MEHVSTVEVSDLKQGARELAKRLREIGAENLGGTIPVVHVPWNAKRADIKRVRAGMLAFAFEVITELGGVDTIRRVAEMNDRSDERQTPEDLETMRLVTAFGSTHIKGVRQLTRKLWARWWAYHVGLPAAVVGCVWWAMT